MKTLNSLIFFGILVSLLVWFAANAVRSLVLASRALRNHFSSDDFKWWCLKRENQVRRNGEPKPKPSKVNFPRAYLNSTTPSRCDNCKSDGPFKPLVNPEGYWVCSKCGTMKEGYPNPPI